MSLLLSIILLESFFVNTLANIAATVIVFVLGLVLGGIVRNVLERRPLRQILGLNKDRETHIVIASPTFVVPGSPNSYNRAKGIPLTPIGPVLAFQRLSKLLATAYPKLETSSLFFASEFSDEGLGDNLILIGFPKANQVTKDVMGDLQLPLRFEDHALVDSQSGEVRYEAVINDGQVKEDFGCLVRVPNPYQPDSMIFIFAGCQTYGVKAAAEFLSPENVFELWNIQVAPLTRRLLSPFPLILPIWRKSLYYQIVVHVIVKQHFISKPQLVAYYPLSLPMVPTPTIPQPNSVTTP